ncbi:MAG: ImmA/IrrE family metallo-endopeptidase [Dehalococcoidia bacterium]
MPTRGVELPERWVTPEVLRWAREQVGLSVELAARKLGLAPETIMAWETGEDSPLLRDLELLAEIYDCPVGYFFLASPPSSEDLRLDFRGVAPGKEASFTYETRLRLRQFVRLIDYASYLLQSLEIRWEPSIPTSAADGSIESIVSRALEQLGIDSQTRSKWSSPQQAFDGWRAAIEQQGIFVIALKLGPGELRGASVWTDPGPPSILVNHADVEAATGRCFTLLHEYAHLLIGQQGMACDFRGQGDQAAIERFANSFAAESIVPRKVFVGFLKANHRHMFREFWGDSLLDEIRAPFQASRDTVAILLEDLSLAPRGYYSQRRRMWDRRRPFGRPGRGGGQTKVDRRIRELGYNLSTLLSAADRQGVTSKLELAEILDMKVERTSEFIAAVT